MKRVVLLLTIFTNFSYGLAPIKAAKDKLGTYLKEGVIIGGEAGVKYSLLNAKHYFSQKYNLERVIFELGDGQSKPLSNKVAYFLASKDKRAISLTVYQMGQSSVSEKQLKNMFLRSPYVEKVNFWFDPYTASTNLLLTLKKDVEAEVFERVSADRASRIVLDIKGRQ